MGIDALAKRYSPLIVCLMLAIAAYFQASGMGRLLGIFISPSAPPPGEHPADAHLPVVRPSDHEKTATAILERNPFDSVTGPLKDVVEGSPPPLDPAVANGDFYKDPPCEVGQAVLIAGAEDPAWSFAAIIGPDGKTSLHRRGEDFYGGKIDFVGDRRTDEERSSTGEHGIWDRVWLLAPNGQRCQLQLGAKPAKMAHAMPPPGAGMPSGMGPLAGKIHQRGEHEFDVDRSALDALIANPADLMKTRIVPAREGDRVVGVKLYGIRPNTLLGQIGLQNGDQLQSINGFEMNDPQKMLEAYTKLMRADHLSATVMRDGRPVQLDFNIK